MIGQESDTDVQAKYSVHLRFAVEPIDTDLKVIKLI